MTVPFLDLKAQYAAIKPDVDAAIAEVLESQQFRGGPIADAFEAELAHFCGTAHALGCGSGTDALWLTLKALGLQAGDEVITSPFTFFATAGAIVNAGGAPVFADIDPKTYCLDPAALEERITPKTKGIIPVHLYGQCADMKTINEIAEKHGLWVLEDCAQAIGAKCGDRHAGSLGKAAALSFYPTKNLGAAGEGGAILTDDAELAGRIRILRCHGMSAQYHHQVVGVNSHLHTIQAAVLRVKLRHLQAWNNARRDNAAYYDAAFALLESVQKPHPAPGNFHVYHQYVIRVPKRDRLADHFKDAGIGYGIFYPTPLHKQPCFANFCGGTQCPEAEKAAEEVIALPIYPELQREQLDAVIRIVETHCTAL